MADSSNRKNLPLRRKKQQPVMELHGYCKICECKKRPFHVKPQSCFADNPAHPSRCTERFRNSVFSLHEGSPGHIEAVSERDDPAEIFKTVERKQTDPKISSEGHFQKYSLLYAIQDRPIRDIASSFSKVIDTRQWTWYGD